MEIDIQPIPIIKGKKSRPEYDLVEIKNFFLLARSEEAGLFVTIEKLQPLPPGVRGGSIANYHRGCASGWSWLLTGMGISHQLVAPRVWQRVMLAGTNGTATERACSP